MKYLIKTGTLLILIIWSWSCTKDSITEIEPPATFEESVAIIDYGITKLITSDNVALTLEMVNFNRDFDLQQEYTIDYIQYTDNGEFNDEVAGDGIYTSVQTFTDDLNEGEVIDEIILNKGDDFKYTEELMNLVNERINEFRPLKSATGITIRIGCKVRVVTCPEYKSCWPFSSPCNCIHYYNCDASIEISTD